MSISEISKSQNIPVKYLEQLIIPLKKAKLISSVRGPKGGYLLSKAPDMIFLWEVLTLLESKMTLVDCVGDSALCDHAKACPVRPVWGKAFDAMVKVFKETSLDNILHSSSDDPIDLDLAL